MGCRECRAFSIMWGRAQDALWETDATGHGDGSGGGGHGGRGDGHDGDDDSDDV